MTKLEDQQKALREWLDSLSTTEARELTIDLLEEMIDLDEITFWPGMTSPAWSGTRYSIVPGQVAYPENW